MIALTFLLLPLTAQAKGVATLALGPIFSLITPSPRPRPPAAVVAPRPAAGGDGRGAAGGDFFTSLPWLVDCAYVSSSAFDCTSKRRCNPSPGADIFPNNAVSPPAATRRRRSAAAGRRWRRTRRGGRRFFYVITAVVSLFRSRGASAVEQHAFSSVCKCTQKRSNR